MGRTPKRNYDERFTLDGADPENVARLLVNTPLNAEIDETERIAEEESEELEELGNKE